MFPIKFEKLLEYLIQIKKTKILFISCISFEPRCLKAVKLLKKRLLGMEISWAFFHIIDNGSQYQDECSEKQLEHKNDIRRMLNLDVEVPEILLFNSKSRPEEELITYCNEILENNNEIQVVICDITTIPKKIYFPFLKWLIEEGNEKEDLIVCYSKPQEYNTEYLESEPQIPEKLIGMFNRKKDIIWIPTLGFKSEFTDILWNHIKKMKSLNIDIRPVLGFPAYRPDFYDRCLLSHIRTFDNKEEFLVSLEKKKILTSADDPFEIFSKLKNIYQHNLDKEIILSPGGPKPICLGLALCSILYNLPVLSVQAKSYHWEYSKGEGKTSGYWIIRDGEFTFEIK